MANLNQIHDRLAPVSSSTEDRLSNLSIQSQADTIRLPVNLPGHVCDVTACDALAKGIQGKRTSPSAVIGGRVRQPALRYTKHPISTRSSTEDRLSNLSIQSQADAIRHPVRLILPSCLPNPYNARAEMVPE